MDTTKLTAEAGPGPGANNPGKLIGTGRASSAESASALLAAFVGFSGMLKSINTLNGSDKGPGTTRPFVSRSKVRVDGAFFLAYEQGFKFLQEFDSFGALHPCLPILHAVPVA